MYYNLNNISIVYDYIFNLYIFIYIFSFKII